MRIVYAKCKPVFFSYCNIKSCYKGTNSRHIWQTALAMTPEMCTYTTLLCYEAAYPQALESLFMELSRNCENS